MQPLSNTETYSLGAISFVCLAILISSLRNNGEPLFDSLAISGLAFAFSYCIIRWSGDTFLKRGFKGRDMSKKQPIEIPEFMGVLPALVYLLALTAFVPFVFKSDIVEMTSGAGNKDDLLEAQQNETVRFLHLFPLEKLAPYGFAGFTLAAAILLGIMDDTFDLRWRHKFFIPAFASLPLLALYGIKYGETHVMVPAPLRGYLGERTELGMLYYVYMAALSIFCPNCINILAGINGIEVGQSLVIACLIVLNDALYLSPTVQQPHPAAESHLLSIYLLLPLIGVSLALLQHNWFPAKVFVGDTYCYFAGMVFAVVAILGHFSKTLLLVFIPQIFNFVYSAPQLFALVPCPRHRLPRFNARTGLLEPSVATFSDERPLRPIVGEVLKILHKLKLVRVAVDETTGRVTESSNLTILNLWLVWRGPLREDRLALEILAMQTACGLAGLWVRHSLALMLFAVDNRF
ncbi:hypothetical protein M409DRAFT_71117 [Zasmidium cellare ATCC 36951]|uniref:UDP-N-acetylglucosamine--dolichyl-phosphate N-acetylglucosaminephosphotransferase n=1 Tax=Zasmidium cellare ATCC 36951 TaxID=1080233 RepID=A0A6A6C0K1_ZASCE|nr:uncharacterized protein M409DRAFT_71117 [Zasmidium cellare ATCC 36951]KAF2159342.1 hypothetical protein M409DRAFT_71117 [Zasmidium cellare ATCC 36951]